MELRANQPSRVALHLEQHVVLREPEVEHFHPAFDPGLNIIDGLVASCLNSLSAETSR
jgi:hypothetical protein